MHLHVFRVVSDAVNHLSGLKFANANSVDGGEERELVFHLLGLQHDADLGCGDWTLKMA
jgi:hypothetical protein